MEARIGRVALQQRFLHLFEKVHVRRVRLDQLVPVVDDDLADQVVLGPVRVDLLQPVQHALVDVVNRQEIAEDRLELGLVEQRVLRVLLDHLLEGVLEELVVLEWGEN